MDGVPFASKMTKETGCGCSSIIQKLVNFRIQHQEFIMEAVACVEVLYFPSVFYGIPVIHDYFKFVTKSWGAFEFFNIKIFRGIRNIFHSYLYMGFIKFRYNSRQNPSTRYCFSVLLFLDSLTHTFRTVFSCIIGFLELAAQCQRYSKFTKWLLNFYIDMFQLALGPIKV